MSPGCDTIAPTTAIAVTGNWQTADFNVDFTDEDDTYGTGVEKGYYQVLDYNGTEWFGNPEQGFFSDNYDAAIGSQYTIPTGGGTWTINSGSLEQTDPVNGNTSICAPLTQNLSNRYLYHFKYRMNSTSGNRRFGFHFFADSTSETNRGNSYFIWFRANTLTATNTLEFYKCYWDAGSNVFSQDKIVQIDTTLAGVWYDLKVIYDRITGTMDVYRNDELLGSYTDTVPIATGKYISFRTGECDMSFDELKVYRSRYPYATVTVGAGNTHMARYQNPNPSTPAAKVKSIAEDFSGNLSSIAYYNVNIDWSAPSSIATINDGTSADIDTLNTQVLSANWSASSDPNSDIAGYSYCIGTTPGDANIVAWTSNLLSTSVTNSSLTLVDGQIYYFSVKAVNGAGLESNVVTSDGQRYLDVTGITESLPASTFQLAPNPVKEQATVTFELTESGSVTLEMLDITGRRIKLLVDQTLQAGSHSVEINVADISQGTYFLQLSISGQRTNLKFNVL